MIKLGTPIKDKATGMDGMAIHMQIQTNGNRFYNFQPRGLNTETGQALKRFWVAPDRIEGGIEIPEADLPVEVLGTQVEDMASGFCGMATAITLHINGCVHCSVQPATLQPKTGEVVKEDDFDIRLLKGPAIKPLDEAALASSQKRNPSPCAMDACGPRAL